MKNIKIKNISLCGVLALLATACNNDMFDKDINRYVVPDDCSVETTGCTDMIRANEASESGLIILEGTVHNIAYYFIGMGYYDVDGVGESSHWQWFPTSWNGEQKYNAFQFQMTRSEAGFDNGDSWTITAGMPEYFSGMDYPAYSDEQLYYDYDELRKTDRTWRLVAPFIPSEPGTYYYRLAMFSGNELARYGETRSVEVELRGKQLWVSHAQIEPQKPMDEEDIVVKK